MHLCMELSAQTWRQSHCCSLSTPVMSHNAIMGFAQRGKLPEKSCQLEFDLSYNNDADRVIFYATRLHTEHTKLPARAQPALQYTSSYGPQKAKSWPDSIAFWLLPHWEVFHSERQKEGTLLPHLLHELTRHSSSVGMTPNQTGARNAHLGAWFFFSSSINLIKCISSYQPSLFYSFWLYSYMTIGI